MPGAPARTAEQWYKHELVRRRWRRAQQAREVAAMMDECRTVLADGMTKGANNGGRRVQSG